MKERTMFEENHGMSVFEMNNSANSGASFGSGYCIAWQMNGMAEIVETSEKSQTGAMMEDIIEACQARADIHSDAEECTQTLVKLKLKLGEVLGLLHQAASEGIQI